MKPFVWQEGMSDEETKNGAYWERNMLALWMAQHMNRMHHAYLNVQGIPDDKIEIRCGWYHHGEYDGWSRVISIMDGQVTFHVPDDFEMGNLPEIKPNWNGHTTEEKWNKVMRICGVQAV